MALTNTTEETTLAALESMNIYVKHNRGLLHHDFFQLFLAAKNALCALNKNSITELRAFANPPMVCVSVFEGIGVLFEPSKAKFEWSDARRLLNDRFLARLLAFNVDAVTDEQLGRLTTILERDECQFDRVRSTSLACSSICLWLRNIVAYRKIKQSQV